MRSVEVTLSDSAVEALSTEGESMGFEDVGEYLEWFLERKFGREECRVESRQATTQDAANSGAGEGDADGDSDGPAIDASEATGRVVRIEDTELSDVTETLDTVEGQRVDEFARRAVAQTRERLGDGAGSGIEYTSRTEIGRDRRPGEDIADLDGLDVPGYDETLIEQRREAVGAALALLKDMDEAKRSDFVGELYEAYPAGYESEQGWWECIKRGLRQVDRVSPAHEGCRIWEFVSTPGRVTRLSI